MQDVGREHRQQRRRSAEEHGEEIKRERTEEQRFAEDETQTAGECCCYRLTAFLAEWRFVSHGEHHEHGSDHECDIDRVAECGATNRVEHTAKCWAEDGRELPTATAPRDGVGETFTGHEFGAECLPRRLQECTCNATRDNHEIDGVDAQLHAHRRAERCIVRE